MVIKEIQEYSVVRTKARAYLCYIMSRQLTNFNPDDHGLENQLKKLLDSIPKADVAYALDAHGVQIIDNVSKIKALSGKRKGLDRSDKSYFYQTLGEHRCVLTDPYPSLENNEMVVTSSFPVYDESNNLLFIICVDIRLDNLLKMIHPSSIDSLFGRFSKFVYGCFSIALMAVALLLFVKGVSSFLSFGTHYSDININEMFKATILLTLALAIFDLVKAIFEEEVLGKEKKDSSGDGHQTMIRFLGSIIIALSIEALMLVFKSALTDPGKLIYAVYLLGGVTALMIGLSIYIKANKTDCK